MPPTVLYRAVVERACSTELESENFRLEAFHEITDLINRRVMRILDLVLLLAESLTSPEKEVRENGTRLLGEVVIRCRPVFGEGELHTLAEFLASRLRDWPCLGPAAAACRSLLEDGFPGQVVPAPGNGSGGGPQLRDESASLVLEAMAEMLRSAQSFRQEERSALLQLLLVAVRRWGRLAGRLAVPLLDAFLGAMDGEKDPRCLLLAFEAVKALCEMHHAPGVDAAPLRQLADEVADWASSYFPISFNPPPNLARGPAAITRANLSSALESALAASPFLAGGVLPLLVEKLSSTYRPAKEDSLSALRRCCPAYGADALGPHVRQIWLALRAEVMAPCGYGGAAAVAPRGGGGGLGSETDSRLALATEAASCLTVVTRAAGPDAIDSMALQDACVRDLLSVIRTAGSPAHASSATATARADAQVLCGCMVLAAVAAAGPDSLSRAHTAVLVQVQSLLSDSLAPTDAHQTYDSRADQTLYGATVLAAVVDAVAAEIRKTCTSRNVGGEVSRGVAVAPSVQTWLAPSATDGLAALAEVKGVLLAGLAVVHARLYPEAGSQCDAVSAELGPGGQQGTATSSDECAAGAADVMAMDTMSPADKAQSLNNFAQPKWYGEAAPAQLRLAAIEAWDSLLRLHDASSATAAPQQLVLSQSELTFAAEHLCNYALTGSGAAGSQTPARMSWGRRINAAQEAAAALQMILQVSRPQPSAAGAGVSNAGTEERASVVQLLVTKLALAMASRDKNGSNTSEGDAGGEVSRAAALQLATQLTQAKEPDHPPAAHGDVCSDGSGAAAFAAALLWTLPPLLLKKGFSRDDEEWLQDCLNQLATRVLPALAAARGPDSAPTASATLVPKTLPLVAGDVSGATYHLVMTTLRAAAEWETTGAGGLPFQRAAVASAAAGRMGEAVTHRSLTAGKNTPLMAAWCAAVQQMTACCDNKQQLSLAVEAAERIVTCSVRSSLPDTESAADPDTDATSGWGPAADLARNAGVALAFAVVAGLRVGVLETRSAQAMADGLLQLIVASQSKPATAPRPHSTATREVSSSCVDCVSGSAAVALAATVNRWQDAHALDAWLSAAFQPALLQRISVTRSTGAAASVADWAPRAGLAAAVSDAPSVAVVRAAGWVGRALALRNHAALNLVVDALIECLRSEPVCSAFNTSTTSSAAGTDRGIASSRNSTVGMSAARVTSAERAMELDTDGDTCMDGASPVPGTGLVQDVELHGDAIAAAAVAGMAAADMFGVLVAEEASAGGVSLAARAPHALCRVLWKQRTYSLCLQALEARYYRDTQQRRQLQDPPTAVWMPLHLAVAISRLAGSAPRHMCRTDATRLAPLLLRSIQSLCRALHSGVGARLAEPDAALAAGALRDALVVLRDWIEAPRDTASEQLRRVLKDKVGELVDCVCAAALVGANAAPGSRVQRPGAPAAVTAWSASCSAAAGGSISPALPPALDAALAASVREEALQCCSGLVDSLPYHVLHPRRQQVLDCVMRRLDDDKRSVRQLAVRARRVWGDT
ncbi:hypothetical protein VaNZ11_007629 [Volvox africanus]|uniref:MMS19 nucleotide excision repair protein n=1 Tax=Volvox africanus TaxID=51714 RepID=A0ABQ5S4I8_9CHLO|nr:hypothetical protein VaNZ11_007629 [Volvox africanus]